MRKARESDQARWLTPALEPTAWQVRGGPRRPSRAASRDTVAPRAWRACRFRRRCSPCDSPPAPPPTSWSPPFATGRGRTRRSQVSSSSSPWSGRNTRVPPPTRRQAEDRTARQPGLARPERRRVQAPAARLLHVPHHAEPVASKLGDRRRRPRLRRDLTPPGPPPAVTAGSAGGGWTRLFRSSRRAPRATSTRLRSSRADATSRTGPPSAPPDRRRRRGRTPRRACDAAGPRSARRRARRCGVRPPRGCPGSAGVRRGAATCEPAGRTRWTTGRRPAAGCSGSQILTFYVLRNGRTVDGQNRHDIVVGQHQVHVIIEDVKKIVLDAKGGLDQHGDDVLTSAAKGDHDYGVRLPAPPAVSDLVDDDLGNHVPSSSVTWGASLVCARIRRRDSMITRPSSVWVRASSRANAVMLPTSVPSRTATYSSTASAGTFLRDPTH